MSGLQGIGFTDFFPDIRAILGGGGFFFHLLSLELVASFNLVLPCEILFDDKGSQPQPAVKAIAKRHEQYD